MFKNFRETFGWGFGLMAGLGAGGTVIMMLDNWLKSRNEKKTEETEDYEVENEVQ